MGRALAETFPAARDTFAEVDEALGLPLSRLMWDGPKETLTLTENAQPALLAVSMAVIRVLEREKGVPLEKTAAFAAGHSLGEYSALAAARAFRLADAVRLVRLRGAAMQKAVPFGEGAMAALLGADIETARKVAEEAAQGEVCAVANDNEPAQVVLSGHKAAIGRAAAAARKYGVRRVIPLQVSAPFHCPLMQPAADAMAEALADVEISSPAVPVVANVRAAPVQDPAEIRRCLVEQVTGTVRWRESVAFMAASGAGTFYEIGAGKVLSGLVRRIDATLTASGIGDPGEVDAALPALQR